MNRVPLISVIIPTYNSAKTIKTCLKAIIGQNYPKDRFEIIVVDNYSKDRTVNISESLGAKLYLQEGIPPQVCLQRNFGAEKAKGEYLFFLDHDMEMSRNLFKNFAEKALEQNDNIDAWYIPERIIGNGYVAYDRKGIFNVGLEINSSRHILSCAICKETLIN